MSGARPGLHIEELHQAFSKGTNWSTEDVAEALRSIREYKAHSGIVVSEAASEKIKAALTDLEGRCNTAASKAVAAAASKVDAALDELAKKVAGGKTPGTSWKANLKDDSPWPDVEREARYHFGVVDGSCSIIKELDSLFVKMDETVTQWKALASALGISTDAALAARVQEATDRGRITATEAYLADVLLNARADRRSGRIQQRFCKMAKHGIDQTSIQPALWQRAQEAAISS